MPSAYGTDSPTAAAAFRLGDGATSNRPASAPIVIDARERRTTDTLGTVERQTRSGPSNDRHAFAPKVRWPAAPLWRREEDCRQPAVGSLNPTDGGRPELAEAERPRGGWRVAGMGRRGRRNPAGSRRCGSVAWTDRSGSFRTTSSADWPRHDRRGYPVELRTAAMAPPGATRRQRKYRARGPSADPLDLLDDLDRSHRSRPGRGCPGLRPPRWRPHLR
jgi:hypothetical protein